MLQELPLGCARMRQVQTSTLVLPMNDFGVKDNFLAAEGVRELYGHLLRQLQSRGSDQAETGLAHVRGARSSETRAACVLGDDYDRHFNECAFCDPAAPSLHESDSGG